MWYEYDGFKPIKWVQKTCFSEGSTTTRKHDQPYLARLQYHNNLFTKSMALKQDDKRSSPAMFSAGDDIPKTVIFAVKNFIDNAKNIQLESKKKKRVLNIIACFKDEKLKWKVSKFQPATQFPGYIYFVPAGISGKQMAAIEKVYCVPQQCKKVFCIRKKWTWKQQFLTATFTTFLQFFFTAHYYFLIKSVLKQ